jgi:hypothetical protein
MAGNNSKPETSVEFAYDQLYDLVKLEEERRAYLDTKAGTYIGLLGVSVSILTAFGGILIIQNGQVLEIKDKGAIHSHNLLLLIYICYFAIIFFFIIAVFFAFRAYNTGSPIFSTENNKSKNGFSLKSFFYIVNLLLCKIANVTIPQDGRYKWIDQESIVINKNSNLAELKSFLVDEINTNVYIINYDLNNIKAIRITKAYISTIFGIFILLIEIVLIMILGIGLI